MAIKKTKQAAKQLEAKRHAELEKRVAEEYDGFEGEEGEYEEGEYEEEESWQKVKKNVKTGVNYMF